MFALEVSLPKLQLPYLISFLSFHNYAIYQILLPNRVNELLDSEQLYQSIKRFDLAIDGLQDAFIKDKVIDIMNMFANHHNVNYTLNNNARASHVLLRFSQSCFKLLQRVILISYQQVIEQKCYIKHAFHE